MTITIPSLFVTTYVTSTQFSTLSLSSSPSLSLSSFSNMSSRDHPFNRSTRPLLAERKPQLLLKKKTDTKLHGFNDFDIISQQYRNLNNHHIGYPYGSPPSPSANSNDFVFSDNNCITQTSPSLNQIYTAKGNHIVTKTTNNSVIRNIYENHRNNDYNEYNNDDDDDNDDRQQDYCTSRTLRINESNNWRTHQQNHNHNHHHQQQHQAQTTNYNHTSSGGGPFIFGIHSANSFKDNNTTTVINSTKNLTKDKVRPVVINQSKSDTSSSTNNSEKESKVLVKYRNKTKTKNEKPVKRKSRPRIKCVLVGDGAVGKTNLIVSYLENRFIREHVPTASDIYNAEVMVNDSPVHVTLCDTAGQDSLDPLRELCYPDSDVFLLCFSVIKPETFRSIKTKWTPKFSKSKAALILVGTQADLRNDKHVLNKLQIHGEKPISFTDAWDLATSIGAKYIETSSFTQEKIKDLFDAAIWEALLPKHLPPTPPLWKKLLCLV